MTNDFDQFLLWEAKSRDTIDFKKIYVDISGDLIAGLLLSQIIYWYLPGEHGHTKLRVRKEGQLWIAKGRDDWWDEIRITAKQFDRACKILIGKGILIKDHFMFDGFRTMHIRLDHSRFMALWDDQVNSTVRPVLPKGEDRSLPKVKTGVDETVRPITETTTKTTTEIFGKSQNSKTNGNGSPLFAKTERLANDIAKEAKTEDPLFVKGAVQLALKVCEACKLDLLTIVALPTQQALISVSIALQVKGVSPADLTAFSAWWYDNTWQGQKGQPPSPQLVGDSWGQFETSRLAPLSPNGSGPILTPSQLAAYQALIDEENQ